MQKFKSLYTRITILFCLIFCLFLIHAPDSNAAPYCCTINDNSSSNNKAFRCSNVQAQDGNQATQACKNLYASEFQTQVTNGTYDVNALEGACTTHTNECKQEGICCFSNTTSQGKVLNCSQSSTTTSRSQCEASGGKIVQDCSTQCTCVGLNQSFPSDPSKKGDYIQGQQRSCCPGLTPNAEGDQVFCRQVVGGKIVTGTQAATQKTIPLQKPKSNVALPGFEGYGEGGSFTVGTTKYITIDWIARYVRWAYQYAIGIAGVFAVMMITFGGIMWLLAAGDAGKITTAKNYITGAVTGLVLILGAYLILNFLNPALVSPRALTIELPNLPQGEGGTGGQNTKCNFNPTASNVKRIDYGGKTWHVCNLTGTLEDLTKLKNANLKVGPAGPFAQVQPKLYQSIQKARDLVASSLGPNVKLDIRSATRSLDSQKRLCDCWVNSQKPGGSCPSTGCGTCNLAGATGCGGNGKSHQTGGAVDITLSGTTTQKIPSNLVSGLGQQSVNINITLQCGGLNMKNNCRSRGLSKHRQSSNCSAEAVFCQDLLYNIMHASGLTHISSEWWHFELP